MSIAAWEVSIGVQCCNERNLPHLFMVQTLSLAITTFDSFLCGNTVFWSDIQRFMYPLSVCGIQCFRNTKVRSTVCEITLYLKHCCYQWNDLLCNSFHGDILVTCLSKIKTQKSPTRNVASRRSSSPFIDQMTSHCTHCGAVWVQVRSNRHILHCDCKQFPPSAKGESGMLSQRNCSYRPTSTTTQHS